MALRHVGGLDHAVVIVRDLDAAADAWRGLGFTLSPRGLHSAHMGTANHTVMLGEDYFELLGVVAETAQNAPLRAALARREGLAMLAFATANAAAGAAELRARGLVAADPVAFSRPVDLPDGGRGEARFEVFHWPADAAPAGIALFACAHLTPELVWLPALKRHANGAKGIRRIEILAEDPAATAAQAARLLGQAASPGPGGGVAVPTGPVRAGLLFFDRARFAARHGTGHGMAEGQAALVLAAAGLAAPVEVPPDRANGIALRLEPASDG